MLKNIYKPCLFILLIVGGALIIKCVVYKNQDITNIGTKIDAVVIGSLAGEYGYEMQVVFAKDGIPLNVNNIVSCPNIITTLNYLDKYYPKIKKVGLVVG